MRKICLISLVISLLACTPALFADSIAPGDIITLTYSSSHESGFAGGPFNVNKGGEFQFETFCVETGEYFTIGQSLEVLSISNQTISTGTALSDQAAYLYYTYRTTGLDTTLGTSRDLQEAIWYAMGLPGGINNSFYNDANTEVSGGWTNNGRVAVLNLINAGGNAQDQLILVPEPAMILMLGLGLGAVGLLSMKFRRK